MALPELPTQGQSPWFTPRNNWDLAVKSELEGRLSETELNATIGEVVAPTRTRLFGAPGGMAVISDSISTFNQGATPSVKVGGNWHGILSVLEGKRFVRGVVYGAPGITVETALGTYLPEVLADVASPPESCAICVGTNNMTDDATLASGLGALLDICDGLENAGIRPVLWFAPPRGDAALGNVLKWNARVAATARTRGYQVVDAYTPLADPLTGGIASTGAYLDGDLVHPNALGHQEIAMFNQARDGWVARFNGWEPLIGYAGDDSNLIPSNQGMFLTDSSGVGTGWTPWGASVVKSIVNSDGINWQRISKPAGINNQGGVQYSITSGFAEGDVLEVTARIRTNNQQCLLAFHLEYLDSGGALLGRGARVQDFQALVTDGVIASRGAPVPDGTVTARVNYQLQLSTPDVDVSADIAQVAVRNLTALGVA